MRLLILVTIIFQYVFCCQVLAQTLSDKWKHEARKATVYIEIPVTNRKTGGVINFTGTGFIISKNGFVLTASHVLKKWLQQSFSEKKNNIIYGRIGSDTSRRIPLMLVDYNAMKDVALMKFKTHKKNFHRLPVCFKRNRNVSGFVAFGYPMGQDLQPTPGIIGGSAPGGRWAASSNFTYGMSGGPVFNKDGVIGIVKGGVKGEPALRWITPVSFAKSLISAAPGYSICGSKEVPVKISSSEIREIINFIETRYDNNVRFQLYKTNIGDNCKYGSNEKVSIIKTSIPKSNTNIHIIYRCERPNFGKSCGGGPWNQRRDRSYKGKVTAKLEIKRSVVSVSNIVDHNKSNLRIYCGRTIVDHLKLLDGYTL